MKVHRVNGLGLKSTIPSASRGLKIKSGIKSASRGLCLVPTSIVQDISSHLAIENTSTKCTFEGILLSTFNWPIFTFNLNNIESNFMSERSPLKMDRTSYSK